LGEEDLMASEKDKTERVYNSYEELEAALLPSEAAPAQEELAADAVALGRAMAAESLQVMARAVKSKKPERRGSKSDTTTKTDEVAT
jgi:hypothetical protein